jgi:RNase P/RNase MRP subunit POP5
VCVIEGPAGCGKTALLDELWRALPSLCLERTWIEPCVHAAPPSALLATFAPASGAPGVAICDGWDERNGDLTTLFPTAPDPNRDVVFVVAGRAPLTAVSLPGRLVERVALGPLGPHEIDAWLARFAFDRRERAVLAARTYGDPLALALAVDVDGLAGTVRIPPAGSEIVEALSAQLIGACRRATTRLALFALALSSPLSTSGLASVMGTEDVSEIVSWLERLAIVRRTPDGLAIPRTVGSYLVRDAGPEDGLLVRFATSRLAALRATG